MLGGQACGQGCWQWRGMAGLEVSALMPTQLSGATPGPTASPRAPLGDRDWAAAGTRLLRPGETGVAGQVTNQSFLPAVGAMHPSPAPSCHQYSHQLRSLGLLPKHTLEPWPSAQLLPRTSRLGVQPGASCLSLNPPEQGWGGRRIFPGTHSPAAGGLGLTLSLEEPQRPTRGREETQKGQWLSRGHTERHA